MSERGWLLLRRHGCLWGIPSTEVRGIKTTAEGLCVMVGRHVLTADEVLSLERGLATRQAGPVVTWAAPPGCQGLAASEHGPLVLIDPTAPPETLRSDDEVDTAAGREHDGA